MAKGFQKCSLFVSFKLLLKVSDIMLRYECHWLIYFLFCGKKVLFMDSRDVCRKRHVKLLVRHNLIMSTVKNLHWKMISYNKVANKNTIHKIAHHKTFYAFRNWQFILFFSWWEVYLANVATSEPDNIISMSQYVLYL